jgi:NTE family protein
MPETVEGLAVPFTAIATDFYAGTEVVIRTGPLIPAIAASSAVPILFQPVVFDGRVMIDGGCVNPVPFERLGDVDFVIASDVVSLPRGGPTACPGRSDRVRVGGAGAQHDPQEKMKAGMGGRTC